MPCRIAVANPPDIEAQASAEEKINRERPDRTQENIGTGYANIEVGKI
jgi:hypothetical protein